MLLLEKYAEQLTKFSNKQLITILENIHVVEFHKLADQVSIVNIEELAGKSVDPKKTVVVGEGVDICKYLPLFQKSRVEHFVQTDREDFFYDLFASCLMLKRPGSFIKKPMPFFINNFRPDVTEDIIRSHTAMFNSTNEKPRVLKEIERFLRDHPKTRNFVESIHMIVDELIMNSIFDAPIDKDNNYLNVGRDRSEEVLLIDGKVVKLFITHDDRKLLVGCEDPYGSVDREHLLGTLINAYSADDQVEGREDSAGAGFGCKMMIDNSSGFYVISNAGQRTLVCAELPLGKGMRHIEKMPKNLHLCFFGEKNAGI